MKERRPLTFTIDEAPLGGFAVFDGRDTEQPLLMTKTTLSEITHGIADMIGQYYLPEPPVVDDEAMAMPRVMREASAPAPRRGFLRAIMGGRE